MIVDVGLYRAGSRVPLAIPPNNLTSVRSELGEGDFLWVGLHEPTVEELEDVAIGFLLHPLAVEDALRAHQRPKLEAYDDTIYFTIRTVWYVEEEDAVETGEIHLFVGDGFVITVRHGQGADLRASRRWLESSRQVLAHGPSAVVYAVCDLVVDGYESVAASLEDDVEEVEQSVFSPSRTDDAARIYTLKREIAEMRRAVFPLRDPMRRFVAGMVPGIDPESAPFFRDVADHLNRVGEAIDSLDNLLSTAFEAHLASISVRQNEDMRKISAGIGLVGVPTLIAGIYGMNFEHMPELHWASGYPFALALMVLSAALLFWAFKRSGWL